MCCGLQISENKRQGFVKVGSTQSQGGKGKPVLGQKKQSPVPPTCQTPVPLVRQIAESTKGEDRQS